MNDIQIELDPPEIIAGATTAVVIRLHNSGANPCSNLILQFSSDGPAHIQGATRIHLPLLPAGGRHEHTLRVTANEPGELWLRGGNFSFANPRPQRIRNWQAALRILPAPPPAPIIPPQLQLICHQGVLRQGEWGRLAGLIRNDGEETILIRELNLQTVAVGDAQLTLDYPLPPGQWLEFTLSLRFDEPGEPPAAIRLKTQSQNRQFYLQFKGAYRVKAAAPTMTSITQYHAQDGVIIARPAFTPGEPTAPPADPDYGCPHCQAATRPTENYCQNCGQSFIWALAQLSLEGKEL